MKKLGVILGLVLLTLGCGGLRHKLGITSATAHIVLVTIQDTVNQTTCDVAPEIPHCITPKQRKVIADKLSKAFQLDIDLTKAIRDWDGTGPTPANISSLLTNLTAITIDIINLIPKSKQKDIMNAKIGVK